MTASLSTMIDGLIWLLDEVPGPPRMTSLSAYPPTRRAAKTPRAFAVGLVSRRRKA
jgi:hypothetical protein